MRAYQIAFAVAMCALSTVAAQAKKYQLELTPQAPQTARWEDGRHAIASVADHSSVLFIGPAPALSKRGAFKLIVTNTGQEPVDVGPKVVSAKLADGTVVPIKTFEEIAHEEKKREAWAAFGAALGAAGRSMQAANAGTVTGYGTYQGNTFGTVGATSYSATTFGSGSFTVYDPARAALAQSVADEENRQAAADMAMQRAARQSALLQNLRMTTVDPGAGVGGMVQFDLPDEVRHSKVPVQVTFTVLIGQDQHQISGTFVPDR